MLDELVQQSPEWREFRRSHIGSSDAPIIMGASPWCTPYKLWRRKLGIDEEVEATPRMRRGIEMENEARIHFEIISNLHVSPRVIVSHDHPWMMASLDGITDDGKDAVEIKCPGQKDHELAKDGKIPDKYYPQLQHQIAVAELDHIFYFSFDGQNGVEIKVYRNDKYIYDMVSKEQEFYNNLIDMISPDLSDKDYVCKAGGRWSETATKWADVKKKIQELEKWEQELRSGLISMCEGQNSVGDGVRASYISKKGSVDWERIIEDLGLDIDLEKYRKKRVEYWNLSRI